MQTKFVLPALFLLGLVALPTWAQASLGRVNVDPSLKPNQDDSSLSPFRDMVVVQKKAMNKADRFLLSTYGSFDFSDGPYTMYGLHVNPGYAISDFLEIYANVAPVFMNGKREFTKQVESAGYTVAASKERSEYGGEIIWAPLYGKDSLGSRRIIRSDTFLKAGVSDVLFQKGSGMKYQLGVGKTYFLSQHFGIRPVVSGNYIDTILQNEKKLRFFAIVELGLVSYF